MTTPRKKRRFSVEHRSTKRLKPNRNGRPLYSNRIISWEEQLSLPPRFHEERDVWPALRILEERGTGKQKEYLLEWEPHPNTGEVFEPTWEPVGHVGHKLKQEWKKTGTTQETASIQSSRAVPHRRLSRPLTSKRRTANRRVIPDSSAETDEAGIEDSARSRTPTLTGSPGSEKSLPSPIEISETQPFALPQEIRVNVPPAPADKSDWESLHNSQFGSYETFDSSSSPVTSGFPSYGGNWREQIPAATIDSCHAPSTGSASSIISSLRSRSSAKHKDSKKISDHLDYRLKTGSPSVTSSVTDGLPSPTGSIQSRSSRNTLPHPEHHIGGPVRHPATSYKPSSKANSTEASRPQRSGRQAPEGRLKPVSPITHASNDASTPPWVFRSQLSPGFSSPLGVDRLAHADRSVKPGRPARRTSSHSTTHSITHSGALGLHKRDNSTADNQTTSDTGMATRGTRQSPRLQTVTPHVSTPAPRIAVRTGSFRSRSGFNPPEHSSPLAATGQLADADHALMQQSDMESPLIHNALQEPNAVDVSIMPVTSIPPSAMHIDPTDPAMLSQLSQESASTDSGLNTITMPIQESIEEHISSAEETSLASKASSSQESLRHERLVPQVDGLVMPSLPILGEGEYAIALPAEGKVQAIYNQTIKVKRKAILKFIRRRGSVNTASTSATKTLERNEMIELIGRLHDTTTHIDLGLPGIPTQYTIPSQEHAAYAEYAGSKFVFLGYLMDLLQRRHETIVIMAKSGATQDLLEEYLYMKKVRVHRHDKPFSSQLSQESSVSASPVVELISTKPNSVAPISSSPSLIIAFDASFEALEPQVKSIKAQSDKPVPIIHLLVTNSSEHVERCLPPSMPSPIRLRLLVRATYQAHMNLGGSPTIITNASDELDGRQMDLGDINRAVRKSPNRRLQMVAAVVANATLSDDFVANWTLSSLPELVLDELDDSPSTGSTVSTTPGRRSRVRSQTPLSRVAGQPVLNRSQTPASRAGTPSARKRQLDSDTTDLIVKRQRITPIHENADGLDVEAVHAREVELNRVIDALRAEVTAETRARAMADDARFAAEKRADEWRSSLATLQRRYEKRTKVSHRQQKTNKALTVAIENGKQRVEKVVAENTNLRAQVLQQKRELERARDDLRAVGGDVTALEVSRAEARQAVSHAAALEKSLDSTKRDFEFLRTQYQDVSHTAAELGSQVTTLEAQVASLRSKASDEKRKLQEMNHVERVRQHTSKIQQLEAEKRSIQVMYKKLEEESKLLKRNRGVQTRGSSIAPGSPGQRSRQGSPASGNLAPPSGSRASVLRHER